MKLKEIEQLWAVDCEFDRTELGDASLRIPFLHNRYLTILNGEAVEMDRILRRQKVLYKKLSRYYEGKCTAEELKEWNREQFQEKASKPQREELIDMDDDMLAFQETLTEQKIKVKYLEEIIKSLHNRGFLIKNRIDWEKYTKGL